MKLIFDFSNMAYISFYGSIRGDKLDPESCPADYSNHVDVFRRKLQNTLEMLPCTEYIFALDNKPMTKYNIFPDYKKSRKRIEFNPKKAILELLGYWRSKVVQLEGYEADDIIASYVAKHIDEGVTVVTTDKDLWQLCENPYTKVYNLQKGYYVAQAHLEDKFKLNKFSQIKLHKTLWGDAGDNVPNLVPRSQKQLLPIIEQTDGSLVDFWKVVEENSKNISTKCLDTLEANKEKLKINYELVRLNFDIDYKEEYLLSSQLLQDAATIL